MIIPRDNIPERISDRDKSQVMARKDEVRVDVYSALLSIYGERADTWGAQIEAKATEAPRLNNAGSVIDQAFLKVNVGTEASRMAADRAVTDAQRSVMEAFDEFSA